MLCTVDRVLQLAKEEEGYLEKKSNACLDYKTANAGYNNYTKYWRDVYPQFQGQAWCDSYQKWLFIKAFGKEKANEVLYGGINSYYTPTSASFFAKKDRLDKLPKVGDQIYFTRNNTINGIYHVGLITNFDGDWITTNEGNTSVTKGVVPNGGGVFPKRYLLANYKDKIFCGHPKYEERPVNTGTGKVLGKVPTFIGIITTKDPNSLVNVRTWAGTEYPNIKSWPQLANGNAVDVCDAVYAKSGEPWYYVRINGRIYGFVRADFVKKWNS